MINLCFYEFAFQVAEGAFATLFVVYAEEKRLLTASLISLLFALRGLTNALMRIPAGKVSDQIGRRYPFYLAAILLALTFLLLSVAQSFFWLSITMIIYGVGFGIYKVISNTLFVENVPPENKVISLSLRFTAMGIGSAVGAFAAGTSAMIVSIPIIFGFCSVIIVTGLLSFVLTKIP